MEPREGNVVRNNTLRRCGSYGVMVYGKSSIVADNAFYYAGQASIAVGPQDYDAAIITGTQITRNRIYKSSGDGIELVRAQKTVVDSNVIVDSAKNGIVLGLSSGRCTIKYNTIRKCRMSGLRIRGADGNNFTNNKISFCKKGINAEAGSNRNRMINNRASKNTFFDLSDSSANCGSNVWKGNTGKGNRACTQQQK